MSTDFSQGAILLRSMKKRQKTVVCLFRVPQLVVDVVGAAAEERGITRSDIVREALAEWFDSRAARKNLTLDAIMTQPAHANFI